jgi:non-specific protein-tyrosine kinase
MKLRKALEKAKLERGASVPLTGKEIRTQLPVENRDTPDYCESCEVEMDRDFLVKQRCVGLLPSHPAADDYKVLRTQIKRKTIESGWRTIMITSPRPGEGKTLTAINLAATFSREHRNTVLLVDADLKKQQVHQVMGFESPYGLADHFLSEVPLNKLIVWPKIEKLTVISGGKTMDESAELLGSPAMGQLVKEMKARYDNRYVFFDVPPVLNGADAMSFARHVDGILMVVRAGYTPMPEIKKALDMLPQDKFLGFAFNYHTPERNSGYYGYYKAG